MSDCAAVRFGEASWERRGQACEPLLDKVEHASEVPTEVLQEARASCEALAHEAACLPLGYLLRAGEAAHLSGEGRVPSDRLFRQAMDRLDGRVWAEAAQEDCEAAAAAGQQAKDAAGCAGVARYVALFGAAGQHADEAHLLLR